MVLAIGIPYLIGILNLTLSPQRVEQRMPGLLSRVLWFAHHTLGWDSLGFTPLEMASNILVFVPLGVLAFLVLRPRIVVALLAGPALSALIEIAQGLFLPDRVASVVDVAMNSTGATAGVLLAWAVSRAVRGESNSE